MFVSPVKFLILLHKYSNMVKSKEEKNPTLVQIGKKIRKLRKSNKDFDNYEVFAFTHKINKVTLQRMEKGENFTMQNFLKVLNALDISLSDFFKDIVQVPIKK